MSESRSKFTRRNVLGMVCFALAFILLFLSLDTALHQEGEYSATWGRIRREKAVPEVLILGNSHAFCSFDPSILSQALGMDAAVLAASGLNSVGVTDSFEAALSVGAPKLIIVESNAYTFDYDATALYHKGTALSNINGMPRLLDRVKSAWREFGYENIPQGAYQLLRADLMWKRWKGSEPVTAADGSSLLPWHATGVYDAQSMQNDARGYWQNVSVNQESDPRNDKQLHRLMQLAKEHGVKVALVKAPTEHQTQFGADLLLYLEQLCSAYGDTFIGLHDFHTDVADMGLTVSDFYDNSHLSRSGAAKLSVHFVSWIADALGMEVKLDQVFAYAGESIAQVADGLWRYEALALGQDVTCRFELDGEAVQDWSAVNAVELNLPPEEASRLTVCLCQGEEEIALSFMTPNTCIFN